MSHIFKNNTLVEYLYYRKIPPLPETFFTMFKNFIQQAIGISPCLLFSIDNAKNIDY